MRPAQPSPIPCPRAGCTNFVHPEWHEPQKWAGKPISGSGGWEYPGACPNCLQIESLEAQDASRRERMTLIRAIAGLEPYADHLRYQDLNGPVIEALGGSADDYMAGACNLFISGPPGVGKTWTGEALLEKAIIDRWPGVHGRVFSTPKEMADLRASIGRKEKRDALYRELLDLEYLLVDEIALYQNSPFVLDSLWILLDQWSRKGRGGLYITANKTLDELSTPDPSGKIILDDRITSRIAGMCRVFSVDGPDRRLKA